MSRERELIALAADTVDMVEEDEDTTAIEGLALALSLIIFDRAEDHDECIAWMRHIVDKMMMVIDEANTSTEGKYMRGNVQKILQMLRD